MPDGIRLLLQNGSAVTVLLELDTLFWVSWLGKGHTDEVPHSIITMQVNGHLEKKGLLFSSNWSFFSLGMNTTNLPVCSQDHAGKIMGLYLLEK